MLAHDVIKFHGIGLVTCFSKNIVKRFTISFSLPAEPYKLDLIVGRVNFRTYKLKIKECYTFEFLAIAKAKLTQQVNEEVGGYQELRITSCLILASTL